MADRVLVISWGESIPGREERGLEVFNEAMGLYGRMQQDGRIEKFDVALFAPSGNIGGYIAIQGSTEQLAALREDDEFRSNNADAAMVVKGLRHLHGSINEGVAREVETYQAAIAKAPQTA